MTLHCDICGSEDYFAVFPGTEAEEQVQANLFVLHPAPEIPAQVWCFEHYPMRAAMIPQQPQSERPPMSRQFRIEIWGTIPDDNHDLDAEAKVATKDPANAIIKTLEGLGLTHCSQKRWTMRPKTPSATKTPEEQPAA